MASLDGFKNFWVVVSTGSASCQDLNKKMKIDDITYVSICGLQKTIQSNNITHLNGGYPQSNMYAMVPTDQTSHDLSYLPLRSSGDM